METIFKKNNEDIKSVDDWRRIASPKGKDKHWVVGRSAYSMADFAINHNKKFKEVVSRILKECELQEQDFKCEPEATAGLGRGMKRGGPRNHDLLMIGKNCVIGIEAKVSETFDDNWEEKQKEQGDNEGTRAFALKEFLIHNNDVDVNKIGYQLFTATRGTMVSAMKAGYENAILLIIVFEGDITLNEGETDEKYNNTVKKNNEDFCKFLSAINADGNGKIQRKIGRETINCWIKKIKIRISDYTIAE